MLYIEENIPFKDLTTLRAGGPARFLIHIKENKDIPEAFLFAKEKGLPVFILGGGSNLLVLDEGFPGVVLKIETTGIIFSEGKDTVEVEAAAGESWDGFVRASIERNLWGVENLSGIPGSVGASVVQNIGAYGSEAKESVCRVEVYDPSSSSFYFLSKEECLFGYRDSIFKQSDKKRLLVTRVFFRLSRISKPLLSYKDLAETFSSCPPALSQEIRDVVLDIRSKKFPDLTLFGTAGSFFKNIIISRKDFALLALKFPDVVAFDVSPDLKKVSSAWILDKVLNLKGYREGNIGLFLKQPLVLVNFGNAKGAEIKTFAEKIKMKVSEETNLSLEEEVIII